MEENPKKTISAQLHDTFWVQYQKRTDLVATIKEDEAFYAGNQYDGPNPNNEPRITINKIQDASRKRASKIAGTPLQITISSSDYDFDCTGLMHYDEYVCSKMNHKAFVFQSAINGDNLGTEITYVAFDNDAPYDIGGFFKGGITETHISPLEIAVANPREHNVQKQEWVMTWTDVYVRHLIAIVEADKATSAKTKKEKKEALLKEGRRVLADSTNPDVDIINNTLVRVYIRFFRINKEVCYVMETENVSLFAYPKPLSKRVSRNYAKKVQEAFDKKDNTAYDKEIDQTCLVKDLDIDFADTIVNGELEEDDDGFSAYQEKFSLYPFAIYTPREINNSIFGMSLTKQMISMQQAINYAASLQVKHLQNMAFAKTVAKEDALGGDVWSNDPADNLQIDHSRGDSFGFKTLEPPNMSNDAYKIPDWLSNMMKDTYGFGEIMSGQISNQDMSGYLYSLALKQANSTLEQEQQLFWQYQIDLLRIRIMFYKHYIDERVYTYEMDEPEYENEERARKAILAGYSRGMIMQNPKDGTDIPYKAIMDRFKDKTNRIQVKRIDGRKMWGVDFDLKFTAQQGMVESELNTVQWYQQMFGNGQIQQYSENPQLLTFVSETAPKGIIPDEYRAIMKHYAERMEMNKVVQLQRQVAQLQAQLQALTGQLAQSEATRKTEEQEFGKRISAASQMVNNAQQQVRQYQQAMKPTQVNEGEVKSNNAKGIQSNVQGLMAGQQII